MNKSESIGNISKALLKAQKAIKAALKDATNPHFKSKYADLSSVVDAVKGPLNDNGISFLQGVEDAENGVAVETMLLHESGEWLSSTIRIPASKQDAQGYGSACTYARRYGLQAMCGVPAEDDDGNAATKAAPRHELTPVESGKSIGGADFENLPPDRQAKLRELHKEVSVEISKKTIEHGYDMYAEIRDSLPAEEHSAFRWLFSSAVRSAFTKIYNQRKEAA